MNRIDPFRSKLSVNVQMLELKSRKIAIILLWLFVCASSAYPQWGGNMGGGKRSGGYDKANRTDKPRDPGSEKSIESLNSADQIFTRLRTLQLDLALTTEQDLLWNQFSDRVRTYIEDLEREKFKAIPMPAASNSQPQLSGISHISHLVDSVRNRYADLEEIEIKTKALHLTLTSGQKIIFDARIPNILVRDIGRSAN